MASRPQSPRPHLSSGRSRLCFPRSSPQLRGPGHGSPTPESEPSPQLGGSWPCSPSPEPRFPCQLRGIAAALPQTLPQLRGVGTCSPRDPQLREIPRMSLTPIFPSAQGDPGRFSPRPSSPLRGIPRMSPTPIFPSAQEDPGPVPPDPQLRGILAVLPADPPLSLTGSRPCLPPLPTSGGSRPCLPPLPMSGRSRACLPPFSTSRGPGRVSLPISGRSRPCLPPLPTSRGPGRRPPSPPGSALTHPNGPEAEVLWGKCCTLGNRVRQSRRNALPEVKVLIGWFCHDQPMGGRPRV